MNRIQLHSDHLEKLVGKITCQVLSQDAIYRKVHLRDIHGSSKTFGIVKFSDVRGSMLETVHQRILKGALLGQSLVHAKIDFEKVYAGSTEVALPPWLQKDFDTLEPASLALYSRIYVNGLNGQPHRNLYAEIIEVVSPSLRGEFTGTAPPLKHLGKGFRELYKAAGLQKQPKKENP